MMRPHLGMALFLGLLFLGPRRTAADPLPSAELAPRSALEQLTDEMTRTPVQGESMALYAHAFAGYAWVNAGLAEPSHARTSAERLDRLIDRMLSPAMGAPFHAGALTVDGHVLSRSIAVRGHLGLMLVGRHLLRPASPRQTVLLQTLLRGLAQDLLREPRHLLPTYGRRTWPADNEVVAAALSLYLLRVEQDATIEAGLSALRGTLGELDHQGLPPSELDRDHLHGRGVPRGCALSWTVAMRGLYDPARAAALYRRYRATYFVSVGPVAGFREWPPGMERPADADSGPIVMGIGTAASGIGLGAARLAGAQGDYETLMAAARLGGLEGLLGQRGHWIERAVALWARTARPFTAPEQARGAPARIR